MPTLTTLADVKLYAGIMDSNKDAVIQSLIDNVTATLAGYCNRDTFFSKTTTEVRDGTGSNQIVLVNSPVTAVATVKINGVSIQPSVGQGAGYMFPMGGRSIVLRGYRFDAGIRNVEITYTAGYNDVNNLCPLPEDLSLAAKMYVLQLFKERDRLGVSSKSLAGESVSYSGDGGNRGGANGNSLGMPAAAANIINRYLNVVPEGGL